MLILYLEHQASASQCKAGIPTVPPLLIHIPSGTFPWQLASPDPRHGRHTLWVLRFLVPWNQILRSIEFTVFLLDALTRLLWLGMLWAFGELQNFKSRSMSSPVPEPAGMSARGVFTTSPEFCKQPISRLTSWIQFSNAISTVDPCRFPAFGGVDLILKWTCYHQQPAQWH